MAAPVDVSGEFPTLLNSEKKVKGDLFIAFFGANKQNFEILVLSDNSS